MDANTGYGNSLNVIQMVKRFEPAVIAGACIGDKKFSIAKMAFLLRKLKKFLMIPYIYQSLIKDSVI